MVGAPWAVGVSVSAGDGTSEIGLEAGLDPNALLMRRLNVPVAGVDGVATTLEKVGGAGEDAVLSEAGTFVAEGDGERGRDTGLDPPNALLMRLLKVPVVGEGATVLALGDIVVPSEPGNVASVAEGGTSEMGRDTGRDPKA